MKYYITIVDNRSGTQLYVDKKGKVTPKSQLLARLETKQADSIVKSIKAAKWFIDNGGELFFSVKKVPYVAHL
jgi:hypothetical protein